MTPDHDPNLTTAMLIGGPQDGVTLRVDKDGDRVQVLEQLDTPVARYRAAANPNRLRLPTPWIDVTYQWDGTIMDFGARRYRRVKP